MEQLAQRLQEIKRKTVVILEENRALKAENERLRAETEEQEKTIVLQKNTITEVTEQIKMIKLAKNLSLSGNDNFDIKIKINELVREIDRCIDLLNE